MIFIMTRASVVGFSLALSALATGFIRRKQIEEENNNNNSKHNIDIEDTF